MDLIRTIVKWAVILAIAVIAITYAGDYMWAKYRMSKAPASSPIEVMSVRKMYAIPQKDGKAEYSFGDPEPEICVHSLFPQLGYQPCWYVQSQAKKPVVL